MAGQSSADQSSGNGSSESEDRNPDKAVDGAKPSFIVADGEIQVHPLIRNRTDADYEFVEKKMNERKDAGIIEIERVDQKSGIETHGDGAGSQKEVILYPSNEISDTRTGVSGNSVGTLHHGENSISGDISTWGTPWDTHRVKLDEDTAYELEQLLIIAAGGQAIASMLAAKFGPIGTVLAAISVGLATKHYLTEKELNERREGHGVEFLFRYADGRINFGPFGEYCLTIGPSSILSQFGFAYLMFYINEVKNQ